jgi:hypothetical protein
MPTECRKRNCLTVAATPVVQRDGVAAAAGYGGAAFKRDGQWTEIFHGHEVREWFQANREKVWTPPQ